MPPETPDRFEELVADALDELPAWVLERLDNVDVFVEARPPAGEPGLLGHYHGVPLARRGFSYSGALPDRIVLYRSTIERVSHGDDDRLRATIKHTVAHEIAHHFGISDERLLEIDAY
jgi:predicted Zn-dependent protease with MMP-like domain